MPKSNHSSKPKSTFSNRLAKGNAGGGYKELTLMEDVIEANKYIGEHIDSLTRRSTMIQEHLAVFHPDLSIRTIRRILSKDVEKS